MTNPAMAQTAIADLLQQWHAVYEAASRPADTAVYRDPNAADAIYYFSPKDILWAFGATVCPPPSNLDAMEKVEV